MGRAADLDRFYEILDKVEAKIGGSKTLGDCDVNAAMFPWQGVYFFFEEGESRQSIAKPRVVRVGTHALNEGATTTLWERLRAHRGCVMGEFTSGGNHRRSIFRRHIGTALINKEGTECNTWGIRAPAGRDVRIAEHKLEVQVSKKIRAMPFLWIKAEDTAGHDTIRGFIERNAVALLSNYERRVVDGQSVGWLGRHCGREEVRRSGLWNVMHVQHVHDPFFLDVLGQLVDRMQEGEMADERDRTLFVTHCSGGKRSAGDPLTLYTSPRIQRFGEMCQEAGVRWAILSAEHALFFPEESHEPYETELRFSGGHCYVFRDGHLLADPEGQAHVAHLVETIKRRCIQLGIDRIMFYVGGAPQRIPSYLLVVHRAIDGCTRHHSTPARVIECIGTDGRLRIATGMLELQAQMRSPGHNLLP